MFSPLMLCLSISYHSLLLLIRWLFGAEDRLLLENTNQFSSCDAKAAVAFLVLREQRFSMGRAVRSPSTCLKTPQICSKEGRLRPFFANNVDIPFARARRLKPCPRKATARSGNQHALTSQFIDFVSKTKILFDVKRNRSPSF